MLSMRTLLLYMATALATGAQVYWLMMSSIWGAPTSRTQYVALCGSLALILAALLAICKARAAITALCASVAIWSFYGPALVVAFFRFPYYYAGIKPTPVSATLTVVPARADTHWFPYRKHVPRGGQSQADNTRAPPSPGIVEEISVSTNYPRTL
jgi:hypothetical protein